MIVIKVNTDAVLCAMAEKEVTYSDLEKASGITTPTIKRLLEDRPTSARTVGKIAKALNLKPAEIMITERK